MIWKILMSVFSDVLSMKDRGQLQWKSLGISCQSLFNERQGGEEREMVSKLGGRTSTFNIYSEDLCSIASVADSSQRLACHCFEIAGLPRRTYFWTLPVAVFGSSGTTIEDRRITKQQPSTRLRLGKRMTNTRELEQ